MAVGAIGSCRRPADCELLDTCPGSLLKRAVALAGEEAAACRQCINDGCAAELRQCEPDFACNFSARCRLKGSPSEYQACLQDLFEIGLTLGHERRFPWEGQGENLFSQCFYAKCRHTCINDPFVCDETEREYDDLHIKVAVRLYPLWNPITQIRVKLCRDVATRAKLEAPDCFDQQRTDDAGIASFNVKGHILAEEMYFEIEGRDDSQGNFPRTIYYPGRLGERDDSRKLNTQLIAIYAISEQIISAGNNALGRGYSVLHDAGQSLILTDSCVWDEVAAPNLRVRVEGVAQCHALPTLCDEAACPPCVWYAVDEFPNRQAQLTDGTGAGIVGLPAGFYDIRVEREDDAGVSERQRVRMENGAMTIVRTWPFESPRTDPLARMLEDAGI